MVCKDSFAILIIYKLSPCNFAAGLSESATVADLKKHMKEAGDIISADIRDGVGYIEYDNSEDMRYAIKKIDDTDLETEEVI